MSAEGGLLHLHAFFLLLTPATCLTCYCPHTAGQQTPLGGGATLFLLNRKWDCCHYHPHPPLAQAHFKVPLHRTRHTHTKTFILALNSDYEYTFLLPLPSTSIYTFRLFPGTHTPHLHTTHRFTPACLAT